MKKFLAFLSVILLFTFTSSAQRFGDGKHSDNTGRVLTYTSSTKSLGSTDSITPNAFHSYYTFSTLTGAKTLYITSTYAKKYDEVTLYFTADTLTAGRVVTFGSHTNSLSWATTSGGTITVKKQKSAVVTFIYDGTQWAEETRAIQY